MGVGHVPQDEAGAKGSRAEFQGPQHRGITRQQYLASVNQARARFAEDLVDRWYVRNGYEVIARNWRCPRGELDVVAWRDGVLVVCEVKARRDGTFVDPFEAVTPRKLLSLRRATAAFIAAMRVSPESRIVRELRFDVAAVTGARLEVRENVA